MLINLSNHPYCDWGEKQKKEAKLQFGEVKDIAFPAISPTGNENYIMELAANYIKMVEQEIENVEDVTIHIMGEMTFVYRVVNHFLSKGICCVASTSIRNVQEFGDGRKEVTFEFEQFRKYI